MLAIGHDERTADTSGSTETSRLLRTPPRRPQEADPLVVHQEVS